MNKTKHKKTKPQPARYLIYVDLRERTDQALFEDYQHKHGLGKTAAATSIILQRLREEGGNGA